MNIQTQLKRNKRFGFSLLGFSLIELLVTITLLSVLLFIALPSFQQLISDTRLSTQSLTLRNVLSTGRSEAINRGEAVRLCNAAPSGMSCVSTALQGTEQWDRALILFVDKNDNRQIDPGVDTVIKRIEVDPSVPIQWNRGGSLSFLPTGRMDWGANGTFVLQDASSGEQVSLVISIQGRVRLQD